MSISRRNLLQLLAASWLMSREGGPALFVGTASANPSASGALTKAARITPECRQAIKRGTAWLQQTLRADGGAGPDRKSAPDLGCTAIVGMALLSQGNTIETGPCRVELRRILGYILTAIEEVPNGSMPVETNTQIQRKIGKFAPLFLMALFLSQVHGDTLPHDDAPVRNALRRLARFISAEQLPDGTWGDNSWAPVLGTVLGWECLRAAASTGIEIHASSDEIGKALLEKIRSRGNGDQNNWMLNYYKETAALRVLYSLGYQNDAVFKETLDRVLKLPQSDNRLFQHAGGEEYLAFYLVTVCALKQQKNPAAAAWYPFARDRIVKLQNADGSWTGHHCITSRTFCTSAALLTLQSADQYLPVSDL